MLTFGSLRSGTRFVYLDKEEKTSSSHVYLKITPRIVDGYNFNAVICFRNYYEYIHFDSNEKVIKLNISCF